MRLARPGTSAVSRAARSVIAAWADWIAAEVPAREAAAGDCGLRGSGGGARSGSDESHLLFSSVLTRRLNLRHKPDRIATASNTGRLAGGGDGVDRPTFKREGLTLG